MRIQLLGTGCPTCEKFEKLVNEALKELKIETVVEKVSDVAEIAAMGVMAMPALAVDGKVVLSGAIPSKERIKELFVTAMLSKGEDDELDGCAGCFG